MKVLPIFYFPTTTIYLTANESPINTISIQQNRFEYIKHYNDPSECLKHLSKRTSFDSSNSYLEACSDHEYYNTLNQTLVNFNVPSMFKLLQQKREKYTEISVLIVDLNSSITASIDFCNKITNKNIKKIVLINESEYENAIIALNHQVIDMVVIKNKPAIDDELQSNIKTLQQKFFIEKTNSLLCHLEARKELPLSDPIFINFFSNWCAQNNIREHYLIDKFGSMALVNTIDQVSYFIIHTDYSLSIFAQSNEESGEADSLIERVQQKKIIPFFGVGKESWEFKSEQWRNYFHEPRVLEGRERYYYATIKQV